mmetsp:Transcript_33/g.58  ORF Transcript_33/g.58 Transcript_33/m.58 type:complete len:475 (-) Transcript_33:2044-3468(-)
MVAKRKKGKKDEASVKEKFEKYRKEVELENAEKQIIMTNFQQKIVRLENELSVQQGKVEELRHIIETKTQENKDLFEQQEYEMRVKDQRIKDMEKEIKKKKTEYQKMLARQESEKQSMISDFELERQHFKSDINDLQQELNTLNQFKKNKVKLEKENRELRASLSKTEQFTNTKIENVKLEHARKLQEEEAMLQQQYQQHKEELKKLSDKHIGAKTLNTMKKNEQLKRELTTQTTETKRILEDNRQLFIQNRDLSHQKALHDSNTQALMEKSIKQQKIIESLRARVNALMDQSGSVPASMIPFDSNENELKSQLKAANAQLLEHHEELLMMKDQNESLQMQCDKLSNEVDNRHSLQDEITNFLMSVMNDIKLKLGPWKSIDSMYHKTGTSSLTQSNEEWNPNSSIIPASLDKLTIKERESVIRYLLSKLHGYSRQLNKRVEEAEVSSSTMLPPIHGYQSYTEKMNRYRKKSFKY